MRLSDKFIQVGTAFPFALRNARGDMLLKPREQITWTKMADILRHHDIYVNEADFQKWMYSYYDKADDLIRQEKPLHEIAQALPKDTFLEDPRAQGDKDVCSVWNSLLTRVSSLQRRPEAIEDLDARLRSILDTIADLIIRRPGDLILCSLAGLQEDRYSYTAAHGLACCSMTMLLANKLQLDHCRAGSLARAALLMNSSISRILDHLRTHSPSENTNTVDSIRAHAADSAEIASRNGIKNELCLSIIRHHHDSAPDQSIPSSRIVGTLEHSLIRLSDLVAEEIAQYHNASVGGGAIKGLIFNPNSELTVHGRVFLECFGMYPPSTFVKLANGEICIVVDRGVRINTPIVKTVYNRDQSPVFEPSTRDTSLLEYRVVSKVARSEIKAAIDIKKFL